MSTSIGTIATGAGNGAAVKPADPNQPQPVVKAKRKRSPSVAKPAYIIVQVLGEDGQPAQSSGRLTRCWKPLRKASILMRSTCV